MREIKSIISLILLTLFSAHLLGKPLDGNELGEAIEKRTFELECRFGNFCDHLSTMPLEWFYTCESYNMRVMHDNMRVVSIYGDHNHGTMGNKDVKVFSNMFTKTNYLPRGLAKFFPNLERFYVASSRLRHIFRKNFIGFYRLKSLDLRFNELQVIPEDAFLDLFTLELLTLSGNRLKTLPINALISLMDLKYFDASDNEIIEYNDEIFSQNSKLEEILLQNNKITSVKANFGNFPDLGFVDLRENACSNTFYLRNHPDYQELHEFQQEINSNCTTRGSTIRQPKMLELKVFQWDICPRLMSSSTNNMLCLIERKFMREKLE